MAVVAGGGRREEGGGRRAADMTRLGTADTRRPPPRRAREVMLSCLCPLIPSSMCALEARSVTVASAPSQSRVLLMYAQCARLF